MIENNDFVWSVFVYGGFFIGIIAVLYLVMRGAKNIFNNGRSNKRGSAAGPKNRHK